MYLLSILKHVHAAVAVELPITDWARAWAVSTQAGLSERVPSDALLPEAAALLRRDAERRARHAERNSELVAKYIHILRFIAWCTECQYIG